MEDPLGLNRLSAALISLYLIAKIIKIKLPWQEVLKTTEPSEAISELDITNLRPDGPLAMKWQNQLTRLRRFINVLRHPVVRPLCALLSSDNKPRWLKSKDIVKILGIKERTAANIRNHVTLILTERFLPSISALGLRYRYVVNFRSKKQLDVTPKILRSEFGSHGVIVRMLGFELYRKDEDDKDKVHRLPTDIQVHLEPIDSKSPEFQESENKMNILLDSEIISFRLDLFNNTSNSDPWTANLDAKPTFPKNEPFWIKRDMDLRKATTISQRQAELLGVLWAHRGSFDSRQRLIDILGYSKRTVTHALDTLFKKEVLSMMYHPALELSGLPEILMFIIRDAPVKTIRRVKRWFLGTLPYVHLIKSCNGRNLIAFIHMPLNKWDSANQVREELKTEVDIRELFIRKKRTYYMTFPFRMYDTENQTWNNPWEV
jgi:hypothetical protein